MEKVQSAPGTCGNTSANGEWRCGQGKKVAGIRVVHEDVGGGGTQALGGKVPGRRY